MRDRSVAFVLFGLLLACYLFTFTGVIQSSDGLSMFATVESMVRRGAIDSNSLLWMGEQQGSFGPDGNLYSRKGLGTAILALPLVWIAKQWSALGLVQAALLLNPLLTAWTGALLYRTARRLGWRQTTAVAVALIFGLGTFAWPYAQTFFSDPVCAWALFGAFYAILCFEQTGRKRHLFWGGVAWGLAYLTRVINLVTLPIYAGMVLWALHRRLQSVTPQAFDRAYARRLLDSWRPLLSFVLPVVAAGALSLWWNAARYGSPWTTGYVETERFLGPSAWPFGIFGLLVGPARGLFWYAPVLLLTIGGVRWCWQRARWLLVVQGALAATYIVLYGAWYMWHGGYSWGPRFLVPLLPFGALLCGPGWRALVGERRWGRAGQLLVGALIALSLLVQILGLLVPFSLVQDYLAATVEPLFARETFVRPGLSPLWLQWRVISADTIHFAWWRADSSVDLWGLLMPLPGIAAGVLLLWQQLRTRQQTGDGLRNRLYGVALGVIALAMLTHLRTADPTLAGSTDDRLATSQIESLERTGDAVLHLQPLSWQRFANLYHGNLPVYGLFGGEQLSTEDAAWLRRLRSQHERLWVVPDYTPVQRSAWETPLRSEEFMLFDEPLGGADGRRLALYALEGAEPMAETALGTLFGASTLEDEESELSEAASVDANSTATGVTSSATALTSTIESAVGSVVPSPVDGQATGSIRLAGYALTPDVQPGEELLISLRWESLREVEQDYHVFVHLLNSSGEKIAQRDGQPVQWMRPTSTWRAGEQIIDHYGLLLPPGTASGEYTVAVGLYEPETGERLPVSAGDGSFAVELGPLAVR